MGSFGGYVGLINYMGARFTASAADFGPMMEELGARGLGYLDDGSSNRSLAAQLAVSQRRAVRARRHAARRQPRARADPRALERARGQGARPKGTAIGVISALPVSIATVAEWARPARRPRHRARSGQRPDESRQTDGRPRGHALPRLRRHRRVQSRRQGLHRPPQARGRPRGLERARLALADAAGRHRQGRGAAEAALCASCSRRPRSARSTPLAEAPDWIYYDLPDDALGHGPQGQVPRPAPALVRLPLHRR